MTMLIEKTGEYGGFRGEGGLITQRMFTSDQAMTEDSQIFSWEENKTISFHSHYFCIFIYHILHISPNRFGTYTIKNTNTAESSIKITNVAYIP
jgi:hypothetical protein